MKLVLEDDKLYSMARLAMSWLFLVVGCVEDKMSDRERYTARERERHTESERERHTESDRAMTKERRSQQASDATRREKIAETKTPRHQNRQETESTVETHE